MSTLPRTTRGKGVKACTLPLLRTSGIGLSLELHLGGEIDFVLGCCNLYDLLIGLVGFPGLSCV